jgi:hypothetical protein
MTENTTLKSDATQENLFLDTKDLRLRRNDDGSLVMESAGGRRPVANIIGAFPLSGPGQMLSLRDDEGQEIGLIESVRDLDNESREVIREELERSYFMPEIVDILEISEQRNLVEWEVLTDRGQRTFHVRNVRRNVRRLGQSRLVIKDFHGNRYEVRDWMKLPLHAQKLLEPYV